MSNDFREYSAAFHYQNNDLMHFGIKGMKWGVRRYQNKDGSLTEEGMKHYGSVKNAYNQMRKKERLRGLLGLPLLAASGNTMINGLKGKNTLTRDSAIQIAAYLPMLAGAYGDSKYNKFLKYYAKELNIDPKYLKAHVRGSDIVKKSRKFGYRKHKHPTGTKSSR